ncbi:MAG: GNAT family N-acetyltransferase [Leptolyngbya sp. SIO3F4]|nr:GNAT family N-acetyltransferase [Leptolyngbya sp. SIO3F4]
MVQITEMTIKHYDAVSELMRNTPGITFRTADSKEATMSYLERNPGLSFVALEDIQVIACAMCGHDGRRGYLQHVVVSSDYRKQGIASALVDCCLSELEAIGIFKTHIDVQADNELANAYWVRRGWSKRDEINRYSFNRSSDPNV